MRGRKQLEGLTEPADQPLCDMGTLHRLFLLSRKPSPHPCPHLTAGLSCSSLQSIHPAPPLPPQPACCSGTGLGVILYIISITSASPSRTLAPGGQHLSSLPKSQALNVEGGVAEMEPLPGILNPPQLRM